MPFPPLHQWLYLFGSYILCFIYICRFGFVEFDSEESCRAAKDDMEDCEIDGSKVTVTYAVSKEEGSARPPSGGKQQGTPTKKLL